MCICTLTHADTITSSFELGVSTVNQIKADLDQFSNLEEPQTSGLTGGSYFKTDSIVYDIDGLKGFAYLFDKNKILRAININFNNYKFYSKFDTISKKYMLTLVQRSLMGYRFARFK
jgi:hypothetical protein